MRYLIFQVLLFFICAVGYAQSDTLKLFGIKNLVFHSELEKSAFECFKDGGECYLMKLALATDKTVDTKNADEYITQFYLFLDALKDDRRFAKNPSRQIKYIFNAIHDKYFVLYRDNPVFSDIFTDGFFNCITASVLYGLAFDYFSIPFEIYLTPTHVYLMAYPGTENLIVETTNPLKGTQLIISSRDKSKAVQELVDMKLVSKDDVNQKGIEQVFNDHYLAQEKPDLMQLIGSLYYNRALADGLNFDLNDSYELFKKSLFLHPRLVTLAIIMSYADMIISKREYENPDVYRVLTEMEKFLGFNYPRQLLIDNCIAYMNEAMHINKYSMIDSAYVWLYNGFTDEYIRDELKFAYHYNKSLDLFVDLKRDDAFRYLEVAHSVKPNDSSVNSLLIDFLWAKLPTLSSDLEAYEFITSVAKNYGSVGDNKRFQIVHQIALLNMMNWHYSHSRYDEAEDYRAEFEELFPPEKIVPENLRFVEQLYATASLFYFRQNKISKSREVLLSGLKYVPDSYDLKIKLRAL